VRIGLTLTGPRQADTLRKMLDTDFGLFDSVQATWNLLEPSAGAALAEARGAGIGVIIKEALANGRLTRRNADPAFAVKRQLLEAVAGRLGTTIENVALAAVLRQPWVDCVLSGTATTAQLAENLQASMVSWDDDAAQDLAALAETPEGYWTIRSGLVWN
jgi:aryl-alcohol dehydrogenase-like predicted oxidoreductase